MTIPRASSALEPTVGLKKTVSKHSVSLDQRIWGRAALDPSTLNKLLETLIGSDAISITVGKKRRVEDLDVQTGPSKRQKFTDVTDGARAQTDDGGEVGLRVSAFKHTYYFAFTLSPSDAENPNKTTEAYREEVEVLNQTLRLLYQSPSLSDQGDIVLPATVTRCSSAEYVRCTLEVYPPDLERPLLSVDVDHLPGRHGSGDHHQINPIAAAHLLRANHGVDLAFSVRLRPTLDPDHSPEHALPLNISIDMEGSLHFPQIARPPHSGYRRNYYEAWNALVRHLFPSSPAYFPDYRGETDITFLYSILEPASSLPSSVSPVHVQPKALLPDLLPFQRRSVLWMLHREGKTLNNKGEVISFKPDYLPLFWEPFQICGRTVYLNRLREVLSLAPPPPDIEHMGGSLNEAPGLGKTVECMALILLNPDIRRNPSVKRWDSDTQVHVREVHVSECMLLIPTSNLIEIFIDDAYYHPCHSSFTMAR